MEIRQLKTTARERVAASRFDAKKLALLFTGIAVAVSFLITLVSFLLSRQIEGTGGLGGIGTRTILSAARLLILIGGTLIMPFWNLGYTQAALDTARDGSATPKTLLEGFRLFFPAVRLFLLQAALLSVISMVAVHAGTILYMLSPVSTVAMTVVEEMLAGGEAALADPAAMEQLVSLFWPMYVIIAIVLLVVMTPVMYRLRLTEFYLVDGMERALQNMVTSNLRMRGNCLWMFKLDISFWWYFLLQGLAAALAYGDVLVGGGDVAYWVFYLLSACAQIAVGWAFLPRVQTSYALAYETLAKEDIQPEPAREA